MNVAFTQYIQYLPLIFVAVSWPPFTCPMIAPDLQDKFK